MNISDNDKVTNRSVVSLGRHCKNLKELQAVDCDHIDKMCLDELKAILPKCNIMSEKLEVLRVIRARKASEMDSCVLGVRAWIPIAAPKVSLYRIMEEHRQMSRTQATNVLTFRFNMI